jgi:hypothetical protein
LNQHTRGCCIDRLSRHDLPGDEATMLDREQQIPAGLYGQRVCVLNAALWSQPE